MMSNDNRTNTASSEDDQRLDITRNDLNWAVEQGLLTSEQVVPLWQQLQQRHGDRRPEQQEQPRRLSASNVAYHIGTSIIALGMIWLLYLAWAHLWNGWIVFVIATVYIVVLAGASHLLWNNYGPRRRIVAGLLLSTAILIVPIAVYGMQEQLGLWHRPPAVDPTHYNPIGYPGDHSQYELINFLPMQCITLLAASVALSYYPFPLITMIITNLVWYMIYDWTASTRFGGYDFPSWICVIYGLVCVVIAFSMETIQRKRRRQQSQQQQHGDLDWSFWIYLIGGLSFWIGLMTPQFWYDAEPTWFSLFVINVLLISLSVLIERRIFMITGLLGGALYVFHLYDLFGQYIFFPFVLTLVGGIIVAWGLYHNRTVTASTTSTTNITSNEDDLLTRLLISEEDDEEESPITIFEDEGQPSPIASRSSSSTPSSADDTDQVEPTEGTATTTTSPHQGEDNA